MGSAGDRQQPEHHFSSYSIRRVKQIKKASLTQIETADHEIGEISIDQAAFLDNRPDYLAIMRYRTCDEFEDIVAVTADPRAFT
jgi:hypothetical protein